MRFPARLACAFLVVGLASPASASLIPDPTIGVRGIGSGSPPTTDGSWFVMNDPCAFGPSEGIGVLLAGLGYSCMNYMLATGPVTSFTVQFADALGNLLAPGQLTYTPSPYTQFQVNVGGPGNVVLASNNGPLTCGVEVTCVKGNDIQFFFLPDAGLVGPFQMSLRAVNGIFNDDLTGPSPIPEPAAALLLALGTAFAARRLRRR